MEPSSRTEMGRARRRSRAFYRNLSRFAVTVAGALGALALLALALAQPLAAGAAALCGFLFFLPGLFFLNRYRHLALRDLALAHAGEVAEAKGVADAEAMGRELRIPRADAEKILRKAVVEGHARGEVDGNGRFVAADAPRCPSCGGPLARDPSPATCPACGADLARPG